VDDARLNSCGCCKGVQKLTPVAEENRPGLSALSYRVGTYGEFKVSMLAALSSKPPLRLLRTRANDDPAIALLDAWAAVLDVLTFYQERIANEGFLRTATEPASILELARSIGYELRPGVAASTYLAFELETAQGAPGYASLDIGARVQSVPGPGEKPQVFETIEKLEARAAWNKLRPRQTQLRSPVEGEVSFYLKGVATNLKPGDAVLIVGKEREEKKVNENWEFRRVAEVKPDAGSDRTLVRVDRELGSEKPPVRAPRKEPKAFALRLRATIFGHNAPVYETLPKEWRDPGGAPYHGRKDRWAEARFTETEGDLQVNLDAVYKEITDNSWVVLERPKLVAGRGSPDRATNAELYRVELIAEETKADFALVAKTTRLTLSGQNFQKFSPRDTSVFAQSEELAWAEAPIHEPVMRNEIVLDQLVEGLEQGRTLIVSGRRARAQIRLDGPSLDLRLAKDPLRHQPLKVGEDWLVLGPPADVPKKPGVKKWRLLGFGGVEGEVEAPEVKIRFLAARPDDEIVSEVVILQEAVPLDEKHTKLRLEQSLENVFDRTTVTVAGNVALATHGETKQEVLGGGDASQPFQKFNLKQKPLTYISASAPGGAASTLQIRVNDLLWDEMASLYGRDAAGQNYIVRLADDGKTVVRFGDGITGARLPSGTENVQANYRVGVGLEGMVKAGQLSLLMTRPLGVKGVRNPLPATGAADPEALDQARENAPQTVLTLDRIVSLDDYEDFARAFAGIGKARAAWIWRGETRIVRITMAAADGSRVEMDSPLYKKLVSAVANCSVPHQPFVVESFVPLTFQVELRVLPDRRSIPEKVFAAVRTALLDAFSFALRQFGESVTESEVMALVQGVEGVEAANLVRLDVPETGPNVLLTLDLSGIKVTEMPR